MGNLIDNYLNSLNTTKPSLPEKKSVRSHFGSTIQNFDQNTDKLIKPLDGKGHLVNSDLVHLPKEMARDAVYTTKALADGVRGKANDHQLGKLNDLGLKLSGIAIATYLMTKKATPKTKAMEFVGFGAFLLSMALWPKIALEIPAKLIHGFNFRKQYIDDQGRKKYVSQDPNYIPFDLYKGDKKSEDLDVIGDRAGIRRDIPNRKEAVKEHMRKVSVQNNTLWMLTAGIATPLMTALACNKAEKYITPLTEKYSNKRVNEQIDKLDDYLNGRMSPQQKASYEASALDSTSSNKELSKLIEEFQGKTVKAEDITKLADTLADGFDAEMKDAARADITRMLGGEKYITGSKSAEKMAESIHSLILTKDSALASKLSPERIGQAISDGIINGAVRDMLTSVGTDIIEPTGMFGNVATNFKCKEIENIDFFKVTEETKHMTPVERLAHNIKSVIMKVNNSNPSEDFIPGMSDLEINDSSLKSRIDAKLQAESEAIARRFYEGDLAISEGRENYITKAINKLYKSEAQRGPKYDKLFASIGDVIKTETASNRGFVITDKAAGTIASASGHIRRFSAVDEILSTSAHFKIEKASETLVANNWAEVTDLMIKELGITDQQIAQAGKDKIYSSELFIKRLEAVCSDEAKYKDFLTKLAAKMAELDEKIDAPNPNGTGRMMSKIESGITRNCTDTGRALEALGMTEMKGKILASTDSTLGINVGSLMNSKIERLHSRVDGVHSSYMRLIETAEFFHRSEGYKAEVAANGGRVTKEIAKKYGFTTDHAMNEKLIEEGRKLLLDAHTNKFYTKMGLHNNKDFFKTLMWSVYRPNQSAVWNENWSSVTEETVKILDGIKSSSEPTLHPRRVFEGMERRPLGQKLKEHMNQVYESLGSISRGVVEEYKETVKVGSVSQAEQRACKRFDLLGKAPSELLHDAMKQKFNSNKWMKIFAPILGVTFGTTLLAQFFFGKKDPDIKA